MGQRLARELIREIRALLTARDRNEASKLVSESLRQFPDNAYLLAVSCRIAMQRNSFEEARMFIVRAIGAAPTVANYHYLSGQIHQRLGELGNAQMAFARAIELNPGVAVHHASAASVMYAMKQFSAASSNYQVALKIDSTRPAWWNGLARSARLAGDLSLAVSAHSKFLELQKARKIIAPATEIKSQQASRRSARGAASSGRQSPVGKKLGSTNRRKPDRSRTIKKKQRSR